MKTCQLCSKQFPIWIKIEGQNKNLSSRKYCLDCSPWGFHNTRKISIPVTSSKSSIEAKEKFCNKCKILKSSSEFYLRRNGTGFSPYCKVCQINQTIERQRRLKQQALEYKGGQCFVCKYQRCVLALEFHHLDPGAKEFTISHCKSTTFNKIKSELNKCIILCSNCHKEYHSGLIALSN